VIPRLTNDVARGLAKRLNGEILFAEGSAGEAAAILADASRALAPDGRLARFTAGYHASVGPLRAAVAALRADDLDPAVGLRWFALGVLAAGSLWDEQAVFDLSDRWVRTARALGALTILPVALKFLAISDWLAGRLGDADEQLAEVRELLAESRQPRLIGINSRGNGLVLKYRGHITEARAAGMAQIHESTARGQQGLADTGRYIVTVADLFSGESPARSRSPSGTPSAPASPERKRTMGLPWQQGPLAPGTTGRLLARPRSRTGRSSPSRYAAACGPGPTATGSPTAQTSCCCMNRVAMKEQTTYPAARYEFATGQPFTAFVARYQTAVPPVREDMFASRDRDTITERTDALATHKFLIYAQMSPSHGISLAGRNQARPMLYLMGTRSPAPWPSPATRPHAGQ
jgi:hypothetical protein